MSWNGNVCLFAAQRLNSSKHDKLRISLISMENFRENVEAIVVEKLSQPKAYS